MSEIYLHPGLRTPFVKAGREYAPHSSLELSVPVMQSMSAAARPDLLVWGQVIPDPALSNIAREIAFEAGLDPAVPAYSTVMACSTSMTATLQAAGMLGRSDMHLALVGGVESMSHSPVAKGWINRLSGRSMGDHMEDTAKELHISRADQDQHALLSHQRAIAAQQAGFFRDLIVPFAGLDHDTLPRRDTSLQKLARLSPAFDNTSGDGTLTAGNSSPLTDGAAAIWVADQEGLGQLGVRPAVELVDWQVEALDFRAEGMLMAPARAIPRLLARNRLRAEEIELWEIHEAFSAQVIANVRAASDRAYRREKARVDFDTGSVPMDLINPHGGSVALGHPFAATGARILSQAVKELAAMRRGARAIVSVCADGGQGTVALLERV
jgi:acetyl-CoA C-acetyltransferase